MAELETRPIGVLRAQAAGRVLRREREGRLLHTEASSCGCAASSRESDVGSRCASATPPRRCAARSATARRDPRRSATSSGREVFGALAV